MYSRQIDRKMIFFQDLYDDEIPDTAWWDGQRKRKLDPAEADPAEIDPAELDPDEVDSAEVGEE